MLRIYAEHRSIARQQVAGNMKYIWIAVALLTIALAPARAANYLKSGAEVTIYGGGTTSSTEWYPIPSWLAGTYSPENGDKNLQYFYGHQQDAQGTIWHAVFLPYSEEQRQDNKLQKYELLQRHYSTKAPDIVTIHDRFRVLSIENGAKQETGETEITNTISPEGKRKNRCVATVIETDRAGRIVKRTNETTIWIRTCKFENADVYLGHNLHQEFEEFLLKTGHPELINKSVAPKTGSS
jgi:hypothetical protein